MEIRATADRNVCEEYLRQQIAANNMQGILRSEVAVTERFLARGAELASVYREIFAHLARDGISWKVFLDRVVSTAAFWSPAKLSGYRANREALEGLNRDIAERAESLASLLRQREELQNHSPFSSNTHYDIVEVIDAASENNGRYRCYLKEPLAHLNARFDTKYWPSLAACIEVIGDDAANAETYASDPLTRAATRSKRASKADFVRALREAIEECRGNFRAAIPREFGPSDEAMAELTNVLLDLPPAEMVDATYVKNLRHRDGRLELAE